MNGTTIRGQVLGRRPGAAEDERPTSPGTGLRPREGMDRIGSKRVVS